jgi:thioredoxin 1
MLLLDSVTDETFASTVLGSDRPVLVDFWAEWCPPCHRIAPVLSELADEFADSLRIVKLDSDNNPLVVRAYGVMSMPTLMMFRGGEAVGVIIGARPKSQLQEFIRTYVEG